MLTTNAEIEELHFQMCLFTRLPVATRCGTSFLSVLNYNYFYIFATFNIYCEFFIFKHMHWVQFINFHFNIKLKCSIFYLSSMCIGNVFTSINYWRVLLFSILLSVSCYYICHNFINWKCFTWLFWKVIHIL